VTYYGRDLRGAQLPFNFQLINAPWNDAALAAVITGYEAALPAGAWPNWVLGNHDNPRIASRVGTAQASVAALLLLTLRGTPMLYYGDELGMTDVPIPAAAAQDPAERRQPGLGLGRDPARTPMPWDASPNGGFTAGVPWLPLGDHAARNVVSEIADSRSLLTLYRTLLALRRAESALTAGTIEAISAKDDVLRFERRLGTTCLSVALNLSDAPRSVNCASGAIRLSTHLDRAGESVRGAFLLRPGEGIIIDASPPARPRGRFGQSRAGSS
jgi:alpha-glucosidase